VLPTPTRVVLQHRLGTGCGYLDPSIVPFSAARPYRLACFRMTA
jgi:hypothetical protein